MKTTKDYMPTDEIRVTVRLPKHIYTRLRSQLVLKGLNFTKFVRAHAIAEIESASKDAK